MANNDKDIQNDLKSPDRTAGDKNKEGQDKQRPPGGEKDALTVLQRVADFAERIRLGDYLEIIQNPKRMIFLNFLYGVARGIGLAVGFTLLGAFIIYLLNRLEILNLPLIGDFITELLKYIDKTYGVRV